MLVEVLFWVFAGILVISALAMICVRNPVHSAMLLVLCFFTSAAIWLLIEAEFLARLRDRQKSGVRRALLGLGEDP